MLKELTSKSIVVEGLYVKKGGKFISNHTVYIPRLNASRVLQYKVLGNWNTHQSCINPLIQINLTYYIDIVPGYQHRNFVYALC